MNADSVGLLAFCLTLVYTLIGLPAQIWQNYRRRSVEGLSLFMNSVLFVVMYTWFLYGLLSDDWYVMASNVPGTICVGIILVQFYLYRTKAN